MRIETAASSGTQEVLPAIFADAHPSARKVQNIYGLVSPVSEYTHGLHLVLGNLEKRMELGNED